jgi:hypothetical protein
VASWPRHPASELETGERRLEATMSMQLLPSKRKAQKTLRVAGDALLAKVKDLVYEGSVRRITITNAAGRTVLEIPLNVGVAGALLRPTWVAVGAIAALASRHTLEVERTT